MFTSRAEYRLQLREDNADLRLTEAGRRLGLVDDARWSAFTRKRDAIEATTRRLAATRIRPGEPEAVALEAALGHPLERERSLLDLLRRPDVGYRSLADNTLWNQDPVVWEQVEIGAKYSGYIERQKEEVAQQASQESVVLPADLDYGTLRGLSKEVQQKLNAARPQTIGQASRIQGITPAAIGLLLVHLKRRAHAEAEGKKSA
jgi:tRNA uridine 5-carboxymethylaminomethyl modification enzyme